MCRGSCIHFSGPGMTSRNSQSAPLTTSTSLSTHTLCWQLCVKTRWLARHLQSQASGNKKTRSRAGTTLDRQPRNCRMRPLIAHFPSSQASRSPVAGVEHSTTERSGAVHISVLRRVFIFAGVFDWNERGPHVIARHASVRPVLKAILVWPGRRWHSRSGLQPVLHVGKHDVVRRGTLGT